MTIQRCYVAERVLSRAEEVGRSAAVQIDWREESIVVSIDRREESIAMSIY